MCCNEFILFARIEKVVVSGSSTKNCCCAALARLVSEIMMSQIGPFLYGDQHLNGIINLQGKKLVARHRRHAAEDYVAFYYRVRNLGETIALLLIANHRLGCPSQPFEYAVHKWVLCIWSWMDGSCTCNAAQVAAAAAATAVQVRLVCARRR